jgi:serine/threonine-protein kinase
MNEGFQLSPQDWATLRRLLDEALDRPDTERQAWLDSLQGERAAFAPRLRSLLAHAGDAPATAARLLETLPKVETGQFAPRPPLAEAPGDTIGPYRLIRELGSGGMASVWLAERTDMLQGRQVALKLPHGAWKRAGLAERLAREREILATLEHPNIARLYDAGVAADGQPWLALEYVDGERIDVYCKKRSLTVKQRLGLFAQVARAVAHAHAHLVVHRDLKPANILVTAAGEVKLLDFGVAKLVAEGVVDETELTREVGRAFTPEYASPEQMLGRPLGTASDVYSLGVVLFELLADTRPYKLESASRAARAALEAAVTEGAVPRPSTLAPAERRAAIRGDLDLIVLKALRAEPARRYATVAALADDVQRHLEARPVLAQPDRALYRVRTLVRRHRVAVGAGVAVAIALIGGAALALWQARQAQTEALRAAEARRLLESVFLDADPMGQSGRAMTARELLRQAHARLAVQPTTDAELRSGLLNTVAASMINLGDFEGAGPALREAVAPLPGQAALPELHAERLRNQRLTAALQGLRSESEAAAKTIAGVIDVVAHDPGRHADEWLAALQVRTQIANGAADYAAAAASALEWIAALERLNRERTPQMVSALSQLANAHDYQRQSDQAFDAARRAYDLARALFPDRPSHPVVNSARMQFAITLADRDELEASLDLMREARRAAAEVFGEDGRTTAWYSGVMTAHLAVAGYAQEAREASRHNIKVIGPTVGSGSMTEAALLDGQSAAALAAFDGATSLEAATRSREIVVRHHGPEHESAFVMQVHRARALILLGRPEEAAALIQEMLEVYRRKGFSGVSTPSYFLGQAQRLMGRPAEALQTQQRALQAVRPGPRARRLAARIQIEMGLGHLALDDPAAARPLLTEALATLLAKHRVDTPDRAAAWLGLGRVELAERRPQEALPLLRQADAFWRQFAPQSRWAGEAAHWLAQAERQAGDPKQAEAHRLRALRLLALSTQPADRALRP